MRLSWGFPTDINNNIFIIEWLGWWCIYMIFLSSVRVATIEVCVSKGDRVREGEGISGLFHLLGWILRVRFLYRFSNEVRLFHIGPNWTNDDIPSREGERGKNDNKNKNKFNRTSTSELNEARINIFLPIVEWKICGMQLSDYSTQCRYTLTQFIVNTIADSHTHTEPNSTEEIPQTHYTRTYAYKTKQQVNIIIKINAFFCH